MRRCWWWSLAVTAALAVAGCDRDAQDAVKQAGTEIKREAKEAGAQAKHTFREVGETTGQVLEDAAVTARVKAALHAEKNVKSRDIDVETFQGKVVIKGVVPDRAQADLAAKVVASVEGVKAVENRLTVTEPAAVDTLTLERLAEENREHRDTAGVSVDGRALGFRPAFLDRATRIVYPSRYADGRLAPFHVLDGLPRPLVVTRHGDGRVVSVKPSVITGFVRGGRFYTRAQAARAGRGH